MITPKETTITYQESTIRIINQPQSVIIRWESAVDGSSGQLQVSRAYWVDGEVIRLVMETIDRCYNKHQRLKNQKRA